MSQPLDLSIILTPPPSGVSPDTIATIALQCELLGVFHSGDLLPNPVSPQEREELRWYLEQYFQWPYEGFLTRGQRIERLLPLIGKRFYQAIFGSAEAKRVLLRWQEHPTAERQISIVSALPQVLSLPWELLHTPDGFLALRARHPISIVRRLPQGDSHPHTLAFTPPLRILLITARPAGPGLGFIDPRGIARELLEELQGPIKEGTIVLEFLRPPTFAALQARLQDQTQPVHILHFDGHGAFNQTDKQGELLFENEEGFKDQKPARDVAQLLRETSVPLVVLTACQSAVGAPDDALSSVAAQLIAQGTDAVVAMSASILVASATRYAEAFYRELARGASVQVAQERARQALQRDPRRHMLQRHSREAGQPLKLRDWWVPQFYQQRPLQVQLPDSMSMASLGAPAAARSQPRIIGMPAKPHYGFIGRERELHLLERWLLHHLLVIIHGFGGIGKTALAREAADWFTRTGVYTAACLVSFAQGGDAMTPLRALGHLLGHAEEDALPSDPKMALARLLPALQRQSILLVVDDLEYLTSGDQVPLAEEQRRALWDTLLELARWKVGVMLLSRDPDVSKGYLSAQEQVISLGLGALDPSAAYLLASRLLDTLHLRERIPYADLRALLNQLDEHPLAIQQVLPALKDVPVTRVRERFAEMLDSFEDKREPERNRSLLVSMEWTLRSLTSRQRAWLPLLALFEGGAHEGNLRSITGIPAPEWGELFAALGKAGLVRVKPIADERVLVFLQSQAISRAGLEAWQQKALELEDVFLSFHPVLLPYVRRAFDARDEALEERYMVCYAQMALHMHLATDDHPQLVRSLVALELPNLRHALHLLLKVQEWEAAVEMVNNLARALNLLTLRQDRDELRQQVAAALDRVEDRSGKQFTAACHFFACGTGEEELVEGNAEAAHQRFVDLLTAIETRSPQEFLGPGSYEHVKVLELLARSLRAMGQPATALTRLNEAIDLIDALIQQAPSIEGLKGFLNDLLQEFGWNAPLQDIVQARGEQLIELGLFPRQLVFHHLHFADERLQMPLGAFASGVMDILNDPERGNLPRGNLKRLQKALLFERGNIFLAQGDYRAAQAQYRQAGEE